jgi:hypothetical protein
MSDKDIKDIWDQKFGTKTKIDTGGAPIWGVGSPGK